ncbi:MAG: hypothetical protein H3Z54_06835 [archaeon]|nr:hypothetical protein [archaeon]
MAVGIKKENLRGKKLIKKLVTLIIISLLWFSSFLVLAPKAEAQSEQTLETKISQNAEYRRQVYEELSKLFSGEYWNEQAYDLLDDITENGRKAMENLVISKILWWWLPEPAKVVKDAGAILTEVVKSFAVLVRAEIIWGMTIAIIDSGAPYAYKIYLADRLAKMATYAQQEIDVSKKILNEQATRQELVGILDEELKILTKTYSEQGEIVPPLPTLIDEFRELAKSKMTSQAAKDFVDNLCRATKNFVEIDVKYVEYIKELYAGQKIPKLAVTPPSYDQMQDILDMLGYPYENIQKSTLTNLVVLEKYDVVFINCAPVYSPVEDTFAPIREFVEEGGVIYASDWAYEYIKGAFPEFVDFVGHVAPSQHAIGTIMDASLKTYLKVDEIEIEYDLSSWVPVSYVSDQVTVYVTNSVEYNGEIHENIPTVIGFKYGKGYVVYTSFHNAAQDELAYRLIEYLALLTTTSKLQTSLENLMWGIGANVEVIYTDKLSEGETISHYYEAKEKANLIFAINWFGSEMKLSIFMPNGALYSSKSSSSPPLIIEVYGAGAGVWTYHIEALDMPSPNYPVVSTVGTTPIQETPAQLWIWITVVITLSMTAIVILTLHRRKMKKAIPPPPPPLNQQFTLSRNYIFAF